MMDNIQNKVKSELEQVSPEKKEQILQDFGTFKTYLGDKVKLGEKMGLGEEQLAKTAEIVAGYLAKKEEPRNAEENLLQELWRSGDKDQQHALSHMLVNMVRK